MKNIKTLVVSAILGLAALNTMAGTAHATLVTYNFSGTSVTDTTGMPIAATFFFGQSVSGSFVLDTSVGDSSGDPNVGDFLGAIISINVTVGGYSASATGGNAFTQNDFPDDAVAIAAFVNDGPFDGSASVSGASVGGLDLGGIIITLQDSTLSALTSDALPSPISLSPFDSVFGTLEFYDPLDQRGDPTSLVFFLESFDTVAQISETGTLAMFSLGLAGLGYARRRKAPA